MRSAHKPAALLSSLLAILASCSNAEDAAPRVTIRVALDEQFSRGLLEEFGRELGLEVEQLHDTEAAKTVGHISTIMAERDAPRCDVFWNNELAQTVRLAQEGILASYASPSASDIPPEWKDADGRWTAFAARARVLIVNTELLPDRSQWPTSYRDLVDPKWKGRCAVAKPLTGTTLTHFTALRLRLGADALDAFFDQMEENEVQFLASNGATMRAVREGKLPWAFTDTDDYHACRQRGFPVACVYPDQRDDQIGTMLIPNSVAILAGAPHAEAARKLVDRILVRDTEARLAASASAQIPLRAGIAGPADPSILRPGSFRPMKWDPDAVARALGESLRAFGKRFE